MTSFAPSMPAAFAPTPSWRLLDDATLGQEIASALRAAPEQTGTELFDAYRLESRGEIVGELERFDATRTVDGRWVTLEILTADACRDSARVARFASIAMAESGLRHRSIVAVLDVGTTADGRPFRVRESVDLEPLAQAIARDGVLPWKRIRSIALQLCGGVSAARARGLRPRELTLVTCHRVRNSRAADEVKLGELVLLDPHNAEREENRAIGGLVAMIEQLTGAGRDHRELAARSETAPPPEFGELLARVRSSNPSRRIHTVAELGREVAGIGAGVTPWSRVRSSSAAGTITSIEQGQPVGPTVVSCARADAPAEQLDAAGRRVIVEEALAPITLQPRVNTSRPRSRSGIAPWVLLAGLVGAGALNLAKPEILPAIVERVDAGFDSLGRSFRSLPPGKLAGAEHPMVPVATVGVPVAAPDVEPLTPVAPVAPIAAIAPVAAPAVAVVEAPAVAVGSPLEVASASASDEPKAQRRRAKRRARAHVPTTPQPAAVAESAPEVDVASAAAVSEPNTADAPAAPEPPVVPEPVAATADVHDVALQPASPIE